MKKQKAVHVRTETIHPGDYLFNKYILRMGWNITQFHEAVGLSRSTCWNILMNRHRITLRSAIHFRHYLQEDQQRLLRLQLDWDCKHWSGQIVPAQKDLRDRQHAAYQLS